MRSILTRALRKGYWHSGEMTRRGPFVTEQEARMVLANAVEQAYDFNPQLAMANVRQEVEDAVRDGRKDCCDAKGNLVCRYSIEEE